MNNVKLYLEGPGQERRAVAVLSTERKSFKDVVDLVFHPARVATDMMVEVKTLVDEEGNLARQIDGEGYKYRFNGSRIPWSLIYG